MQRRTFIKLAGSTVIIGGVICYIGSDRKNLVRADINDDLLRPASLSIDERAILHLASLAPSGHNTQPWFVKIIAPYHWVICNDKTRWLNAVDPTQRETILSIGAFIQNLEYAGISLGYSSKTILLAQSNTDEEIVAVQLKKSGTALEYNSERIIQRRTVRSGYLNDLLKKEDIAYLLEHEKDFIDYIPANTKESDRLKEQTLEANRIQIYRDEAQKELSEWIRFSGSEAEKHRDGLTMASMEIEGFNGWILRNFYNKEDVMKVGFRRKSMDSVKEQTDHCAGWIIITSKDNTPASLLETGKRFQRLLLKIREKNIAIHPMTQILEEFPTEQILHSPIGNDDKVQFILRTGYIKSYPPAVSLRRPVESFIRN